MKSFLCRLVGNDGCTRKNTKPREHRECNRGRPPCIEAGLMKRLSRRFLVAPTPEHHTSKTCAKCLGPCGAHPTLHHRRRVRSNGECTWRDVSIGGLRLCQQEDCKFLQNRDRAAAGLIGLNLFRLSFDSREQRLASRKRHLSEKTRCFRTVSIAGATLPASSETGVVQSQRVVVKTVNTVKALAQQTEDVVECLINLKVKVLRRCHCI